MSTHIEPGLAPDGASFSRASEIKEAFGTQRVIDQLAELAVHPTSPEGNMGGVARQARELCASLQYAKNSLTSEQAIQALNLLTTLDYYLQVPAEPDDVFDVPELVRDLQDLAYGPGVRKERLIERQSLKHEQLTIQWHGAPIDVLPGDFEAEVSRPPQIRLQQDGAGRWLYSIDGTEPRLLAPTGYTFGREVFDSTGRGNILSEVSRQHVYIVPTEKGEVTIGDISTNGTAIETNTYPLP